MIKKRLLLTAGLFCGFALFLFSCKSTPAVEPVPTPSSTPAPTPVAVVATPSPEVKPVDDALKDLRSKAENLQAECKKYALDTLLSQQWADALASHEQADSLYGKEYDGSTSAYKKAIEIYEQMLSEGLSKVLADIAAELAAARASAVAAGALEYYPEQFSLADTSAEKASELYNSGETASAYDESQKALLRYKLLENGMTALGLRKKIQTNEFESVLPETLSESDALYEQALSGYGVEDAAALEASEQALGLYAKVINAGYKMWTEPLVVKNAEVKALCDSIKASRSMKEAYDAAVTLESSAIGHASDNQWEPSYYAYSESMIAYANVYQQVSLKKNAADVAIEAAKKKQAESSELALRADEIAPLPVPEEPTAAPVAEPTAVPVAEPTAAPVAEPTAVPVAEPTAAPVAEPTAMPVAEPTAAPAPSIKSASEVEGPK